MNFWLKILTYTLPAGRVFGVPLRVHWLMLVTLPLFIAPFAGARGASGLGLGLLVFGVLYGSILFHELGHAWGMKLVGSRAEEIWLTPIGGVASGGGADISPRTELIVVGLGPAASALLALIGWIATFALGKLGEGVPSWVFVAAGSVKTLNTMLLLFNLLVPIFPLDGAKLIRAALSLKFNPNKMTYYLANAGIALCLVLLLASAFDIRVPGIGSIGGLLFLILLLGGLTCWQTLQALQHQNVYAAMDSWGERTVYYDDDAMRSVRSQLGGLVPAKRAPSGGGFRPSTVKKGNGEARVVAAIPDPEKVSDPLVLAEMLKAAVTAEDFKMAARIKARIDKIKG